MSRTLHAAARRLALPALALLMATTAMACSDGGSGASSSNAPDHPAATTTPVDPGSGNGVRSLHLAITDRSLGRLTFDALAAGDPTLAARGKLVLLLHGWPQSSESFRAEMPEIARAGYYVVAPDQRGYSPGARPTQVGDYAMTHLVDDTLAIATALGADRFHLVGHDWGGGVGWATARREPKRVSSLVVLSWPHTDALTAARATPGDPQAAASKYIDFIEGPTSQATMLAKGATSFVTILTSRGLPAGPAATYAKLLGTPDALRAANNWFRANPTGAPTHLGPVNVPTRYVYGTADQVFVRSTAQATAKHVTGPYKYQEVAGGLHWLPETSPDVVTQAILDDLRAAP